MAIHDVKEALRRLARGELILVRDDGERENEGDLVGAAALASPEMVNFMVTHGRGLVCQSISEETARRLALPPQVTENTESMGTAFTVSVDAREGTSSGISAGDRARTALVLADPGSRSQDLRRPGHLFPLVARPGGVLERPGHTEASFDLVRLAGLSGGGLICELLNDDGTMARDGQLESLAVEWDMPLISVQDLIDYRYSLCDVEFEVGPTVNLPAEAGVLQSTMFRTRDSSAREAVLIEAPDTKWDRSPAPLVRIHSECFTGEALRSQRCDCGPQLDAAMHAVAREGGAVVYLRQEGRGIGLYEKMRAYALQDRGLDTVDANHELGHSADARRFGLAGAILRYRGARRVRLMTNNPDKVRELEAAGVAVCQRIPLHVGHSDHNQEYRTTKIARFGHYKEYV